LADLRGVSFGVKIRRDAMRWFLTVLAACLMSMGARGEDVLNLGDVAPPLAVGGWVKGEKVAEFRPGAIYVVEFWSTWCIPCRPCYPHLSELARKYKEVRFVGVDIWESNPERVRPFVDEMGDKMDYSIAVDDVPAAGDAPGVMARTWMIAAEEHAIPVAFIISDAKLVWIGHPMLMDGPLAKIAAGEWDWKGPARERLAAKTRERLVARAREQVYTPYNDGDFKTAVTAIDRGAAAAPELAAEFEPIKIASLCLGDGIDAGLQQGSRFIEAKKHRADELNYLASHLVRDGLARDPDPRVSRFALKAAGRAVELTNGEHVGYLKTLAQAQFRTGNPSAALATQEKAMKHFENEVVPADSYISTVTRAASLKRFQETLDRYRKAAEAKDSRP
jgi:thiol-disulfide isomerase/thioredoxin